MTVHTLFAPSRLVRLLVCCLVLLLAIAPVMASPTSQLARQILNFLQDNGIDTGALNATLALEYDKGRPVGVDARFNLLHSELQVAGDPFGPQVDLNWRLQVPQLASLLPAIAGRVQGEGSFKGSIDDPQMRITVQFDELRQAGEMLLDKAQLSIEGKASAHRINLTAHSGSWRMTASLSGAVSGTDATAWHGKLTALRITQEAEKGGGSIELAAAAELHADAKGVQLQDAHFRLTPGDATVHVKLLRSAGYDAQAPVHLALSAKLPELAKLASLLPQMTMGSRLEMSGAAEMTLQVEGSWAEPQATGQIHGSDLRLALAEEGLILNQGSLSGHFNNAQLLLDSLTLQGEKNAEGPGGSLELSGSWPLSAAAGEAANIRMVMHELRALSRPDRWLVLDGEAQLGKDEAGLFVTGDVRVVRGFVSLPDDLGMTYSEDVEVLGRPKLVADNSADAGRLDLKLDMGKAFRFSGRGLETHLAGELRLKVEPQAAPGIHGILRLEQGRYAAWGQKLKIERGLLNFSGPLDNPGLDILALRSDLPVQVGVEVRGTAVQPQARLTSEPWMPDADKLSWMVLGHGMESSGKTDWSLLATAAETLLGSRQAGELQNRMAYTFGFDELSLSSGSSGSGLEGTVLTVGKRLSGAARVSIEQAIGGVGAVARLSYQLSERLSVRSQAGTSNAVDLLYTWSYD